MLLNGGVGDAEAPIFWLHNAKRLTGKSPNAEKD